MPPSDEAIRAAILSLTARRAGSICPSEAARLLAADWRALMPAVRQVALAMARTGEIAVTQGGRPVEGAPRGPIRLRRP
ncbi:MAG: DUF3253 domain-containing protein [Gemmobacter sp.]